MKSPVKLTARRQKEFMEALRALGGRSGNISLMERLGWNKEFYDRVRDSLGDKLRAGPGHGGTVHIRVHIKTTDTAQVKENDPYHTQKRDVRAFIAMPNDSTDPSLEDLLETIKTAAIQCRIRAMWNTGE